MTDQPLITQEELDILSASMQIAQQQARHGRAAEVALYDFREATKLSPDQTHELKDRCVVLSKVLSRTISAYLNAPLTLSFESLDHPSFDQYLRGLPPNPVLAVFHLDPHTAPAVWQFDLQLALSLVNTMLGGTEATTPSNARDLTAIEQALLTRLFNEILQTWGLTWPALANFHPTIHNLTTTVANLDITAYAQDIVHAAFRCNLGDISGPSHLALPHVSLQRLLRSARKDPPTEIAPSDASLSGRVSRHAQHSNVRITAEMARIRLPLRHLVSLKPGDVIPLHLHPSQPLTVTLAGTPKFHGQAGQYLAHRAVRITAPLSCR